VRVRAEAEDQIIDDEEAMRGLFCMWLSDLYEIIETGEPEQALGLALEHKPDVILMDLMMPKCSGFELCQSLHSLSYTSLIPIFMITGESATKYREHCKSLGAKGYFEKRVDFAALRATLADEIRGKQPERGGYVRVRMRLTLKLKGTDATGRQFEESATTENVSVSGFLISLQLHGGDDERIVRRSIPGGRTRSLRRARAGRPAGGSRCTVAAIRPPVSGNDQ